MRLDHLSFFLLALCSGLWSHTPNQLYSRGFDSFLIGVTLHFLGLGLRSGK